jgi:Flp pilus assembly pilin Flp
MGGTSVLLAEEGADTRIPVTDQLRDPPVRARGRVCREKEEPVAKRLQQLWNDERGQDIAEYAVMLAVILVIVVGTIRLIGSNANNVFSQVGSAIQ